MLGDHILSRSFYERSALDVARDLLGMRLVRQINDDKMTGLIVETEAYRGSDDPASHAFRGRTLRNSVMYDHGGLAYVYFIYGRNWCLNITAESKGTPAAVLVRAVEPEYGLGFMLSRRGSCRHCEVANGPGKLTQALGITGSLNGVNLTRKGPLYMTQGKHEDVEVVVTRRIGIRKGTSLPWRFHMRGSPFVSKR
jgi:DNA-3-methyladenine glycosylase